MFRGLVPALCFVMPSVAALAQSPSSLDGKWTAHYLTGNGGERDAEVTISHGGGSWRDTAKGIQGKKNPCLGKEYALQVSTRSQPTEEIKMAVSASDVLQGCGNHHVTLRALDGNTLEGTFKDGRAIKLVRQ
jgi:hypothetical protein